VCTAFTLLLLATVVLRRGFANDLAAVLAAHWTAWVVLALVVYAVISAVLMPRLLAGVTTAFVAVPGIGIFELPLAPTSGNITHTAYFVVGALTYFAISILILRGQRLDHIRWGYFAFVTLNAALGLIDLLGKSIGAGDLLAPLRSAGYALQVEVDVAGFWRIVGGFSEASAFGGATLACLAFTYSYWRVSRSLPAYIVTLLMLCLLVLSTSTTVYVGLAILLGLVAASMMIAALQGRTSIQDLILVASLWMGATLALSVYLYEENYFAPLLELLDAVVFNKAMSDSAVERSYWNAQALQALWDTGGLGIGMGSSRSSSWIVSVFSQLGIFGGLMMMSLVAALISGGRSRLGPNRTMALIAGTRTSTIALLIGATISGAGADPGLLFFVAVAIVVRSQHRAPQPSFLPSTPRAD
jgi:hypothetical protein